MANFRNTFTNKVLTGCELYHLLECGCSNKYYSSWRWLDESNDVSMLGRDWYKYWVTNNIDPCTDGNKPVNVVPPFVSGIERIGFNLSSTSGTWTSDTGIIPPYTYQWYRGASQIVGETNNTYTLVALDMDEYISCRVTACDTDGCTTATSNSILIPLFWISGGSKVWGTATNNIYD